jgi:hypothetical protein
MQTSGMIRRVALVRTDVSEERSSSIISVIRIDELRTTFALTRNPRTHDAPDDGGIGSSKTSVLTRATRHDIPEDGIFQEITDLAKNNI